MSNRPAIPTDIAEEVLNDAKQSALRKQSIVYSSIAVLTFGLNW
jgi:hypothetical protein